MTSEGNFVEVMLPYKDLSNNSSVRFNNEYQYCQVKKLFIIQKNQCISLSQNSFQKQTPNYPFAYENKRI